MSGVFGIAARNAALLTGRARLLMVIMAGASALLVWVLALGAGIAKAHRSAITSLVSGDVNVGGFFKVHPDTLSPVVPKAQEVQEKIAPVLPTGCSVRERGRGFATVWAGRLKADSFLVGLDPRREAARLPEFRMRSGSLAELSGKNTVAFSRPLADRLEVREGDLVTLYARTAFGQQNALDLRVTGVVESEGLMGETAGIFVSLATTNALFGYREGAAGVLQIVCGDEVEVDPLAGVLRGRLREAGYEVLPPGGQAFADKMGPLLREGWTGQRLDVSTWEDEGSFLSFVTDGMGLLTAILFVTVIVLVFAGIFVSLGVSVRERLRELGTLRAVGMHRRQLLMMILFEAVMLAFAASLVGGLVALALGSILNGAIELPEAASTLLLSRRLPLEPNLIHVFVSMVVVIASSAAAALFPAWRAAKVTPRTAMEAAL